MLAALDWVSSLLVVLVALLHAREHLSAVLAGDVHGLSSEVGSEEGGEGRHHGGGDGLVRVLCGVHGLEENSGVEAESLQVGVQELPS